MKKLAGALAAACAMFGVAAAAPMTMSNLIENGDFEDGVMDFSTDYMLDVTQKAGGTYYIRVAAPNGWADGLGDHTSGSGFMAVYNASIDAGQKLWEQTVDLALGTNYTFEGWVANLTFSSPILELFVNGYSAGLVNVAEISDVWQKFAFSFDAPFSGAVTLALVNNNLVWSGADFALDDLSLMASGDAIATPIPGALPLMLSGLVGGAFLRRRKTMKSA